MRKPRCRARSRSARSSRGRRVTAILFAALACSGCATGLGARAPADPLATFLERAAPFGLSASVLVLEDGEIRLREGYGTADLERGITNTPGTVLYVGSLTKQFTAAAILALQERGTLSVDDPIARFFPHAPDDKRAITLHHLLTHTAGLDPDAEGLDTDVIGRDSLVRSVLRSELVAPPGEEFAYANEGYSLLAAVIEVASGTTYERFLGEALFRPAGMTRTGYVLPDWEAAELARGYADGEPVPIWRDGPGAADGPTWNLVGAGGMLSTADDLARWIRALSTDSVLSAESRAALLHPHVPLDPDGTVAYGYGWIVERANGGRVVWHNGSNGVYYAELRWDPDRGDALVFLANQVDAGNFPFEDVVALFARDLFSMARGDRPVPDAPAGATPGTPDELAPLADVYALDGGGRLVVTVAGGGLRVEPVGQDAVEALLALEPETAATYADRSRRASALVGGLLAGEWSGLEAAAGEGALERARRLLEGARDRAEQRHGPVVGHEILGTVGMWWYPPPDDRRPATFVRLESERGEEIVRLTWREGKVAGLEGLDLASPAPILFLPTPAGDFAALHPRLDVAPRIRFEDDGPARLVIESPAGERVARRIGVGP